MHQKSIHESLYLNMIHITTPEQHSGYVVSTVMLQEEVLGLIPAIQIFLF